MNDDASDATVLSIAAQIKEMMALLTYANSRYALAA
jgi:hypothetical protein